MGRRRQLIAGLIMLIGGLVVVAIRTISPSSDPLVALGWLVALGILSQVPDSLAGLNGSFVLVPLRG
jgi:hypothetical protein